MPSKTAKTGALHGIGAVAVLVVAFLALQNCSDAGPKLSEAAERGRKVFRLQCAACHNARDPFKNGNQGPGIARSSRELLEARVLRLEYPPGYEPKQPGTTAMTKMPWLKEEIGDIWAFLNEVPEPK